MTGRGIENLTDEDIARINYISAGPNHETMFGQFEPDYTIEDVLQLPTYEIGDKYMYISDPAWGEAIIGDEPHDAVLLELARTPLFRRLQSIEQLTLNQVYATMPNSMYFSRWQHIWGSLVFVRKMTEGREDIGDREKMVLQLRTLLSDVGHTAFSHLGDWMFQGLDGGEDLHDQDLKELLAVGGIEEILQRHGFSLDETVFPETEDWVECPSPDLCVDRVDYGMREILRWGVPTIPWNMHLRELHDPQSVFEIDEDKQLVVRSKKAAQYFAAGFSILPTEHWSHPVHRLQLQFMQSAVRSSVIMRAEEEDIHPREALYAVDQNFYSHFHTWEMLHLQNTMKETGKTQRRIFTQARRADLNKIFSGIVDDGWTFPEFPDPLKSYTWQSEEFGEPYPPNIVIEETTEKPTDMVQATERGLEVYLPALKARAVDPYVRIENGEKKRLSEIDPSYEKYLAGQRKQMAKAYKATVLMRPDIATRIVKRNQEDEKDWALMLRRKRSSAALKRVVGFAEFEGAGNRFDTIREVEDEDILARQRVMRRIGAIAIDTGEDDEPVED
jgi:HD superfamily phosphohydrolase